MLDMFQRAFNNDVDYLKSHIEDIHQLDDKKRNILFYAVLGNASDAIRFLLDTDIPINHVDIYGETVLFECARKAKLESAKQLIKKYIAVNIQNRKGETAFHLAAQKGDLMMLRLLIENQALVQVKTLDGKSPIHYAILGGDLKALQFLVAETKTSLIEVDDYQNTLLHHASKTHHLNIIDWLLKEGLNVNLQNDQYETALFYAVRFGTKDCVYALLNYDAYLDIKNRRFETVFDICLLHDKLNLLEDLKVYKERAKYQKLIKEQALTLAVLNRDLAALKKCVSEEVPLKKDRYHLTAKDYAKLYKFQLGLRILNEL